MRAGKSSGALIQQVLLAIFPAATLMDLSPIVSGIFLVLLVGWILATINLSKLFDKAQ
jgi:ATP/ADP translocase